MSVPFCFKSSERGWCITSSSFLSSRGRHTRCSRDWSSDVCSSDLLHARMPAVELPHQQAQVIAQLTAEVVCRPAQSDLEAKACVHAERQPVEEVREGKVDLHSAPVDPPLQPDPGAKDRGDQHQARKELTQQVPPPAAADA